MYLGVRAYVADVSWASILEAVLLVSCVKVDPQNDGVARTTPCRELMIKN